MNATRVARLRRRFCRHRWVGISFSYASWVECEKCGARR